MEKLRIVFLITDLGKGGAERYLVDLCKALSKREDVEFVIGTLYDNNQYEEETRGFRITDLNFQTFSFRRKNENSAYRSLLMEFRPHVVHTHRFLAEFLSSYYVNPEITYICHGHDNMEQLDNFSINSLFSRKKLIQLLEKKHLVKNKYRKITTHFIANSHHTLQYYQRVLPRNMTKNIQLIYYGFDYDKFRRKDQAGKQTSQPVRLINVGSFQLKKNQELLVKICQELDKRQIPFRLKMIGNGEHYDRIKNLTESAGLEEKIEMPGIVHQVESIYPQQDIYIHTAWYEPFGLVFLEAMATGLPVITLNGKGNADLIEEGKNGFLIQEQNPSLFADKIELLINNPGLYNSASEYAIHYAAKYKMEYHLEKIMKLYNQQRNTYN